MLWNRPRGPETDFRFQSRTPEEEELIRETLETAGQTEVMGGTRERKTMRLGEDGRPLYTREEGVLINGQGEFIQERTDTLGDLDCGCPSLGPQSIGGRDYITHEVACKNHLMRCQKCYRQICVHNVKKAGGKLVCQRCAGKCRSQAILLFPLRLIKELFLGLAGIPVEPEEPAVVDLESEHEPAFQQAQPAYPTARELPPPDRVRQPRRSY